MNKAEHIFDALLVLQYQAGNKNAMNLLVKRWHHRLCRQAFWYTKDMDTAKDIVQDSWGTAMNKLYLLRDPNSFGSWIRTVVNRKSLDWIKKNSRENTRKKEHIYLQEENSSDKEDPEEDVTLLILKAIKELPAHQQLILNLFYVESHSMKEISKILNVSVGTVKSRLFHAREKLKLILKKHKR
ncbi:sigma-70 family RNA polymerase sigma factor [Leptobacterium flavescens]|uniref:Sigma-70 family RNA polymerase sigma factor n=1 Tax=Leptobacterium flavescens TaxID=472055 RepID=A0A6P0ULF6_9FLAO|nr:RNA polymerase sigma factor [Leptobacterium flavescens]NER14191.1 sigma-70 family RNA polymerase sigma factor [Leptobacterium flavescens]